MSKKYPPYDNLKPLAELLPLAEDAIKNGALCFQHTNCENCNTRQEIQYPNVFYTSITCEECGHMTDTKYRGSGFTAVFTNDRKSLIDAINKIIEEDGNKEDAAK